jgi:hypothetical protein
VNEFSATGKNSAPQSRTSLTNEMAPIQLSVEAERI